MTRVGSQRHKNKSSHRKRTNFATFWIYSNEERLQLLIRFCLSACVAEVVEADLMPKMSILN
jgi:hypothetical protein